MGSLLLSLKKMVVAECHVRGVKPEDIPTADPVIGGTGLVQLDSLDAVEIVTCIERTLGLKADSMPLKNIFRSYEELATYIEKHAAPDKIAAFTEKY
jgi:acyl carrier protein